MAIINDTYLIINSIIEQTEGKKGLAVTDVSGLASFGEKLLTSTENNSRDVVFKALLDRIGKTIIDMLPYDNKFSRIYKDAFAYGSILQTIHVGNFTAKKSGVYDNLSNGDVDGDVYKTMLANVDQTLYENIQPWEFGVTIFDKQIESAFTSPEGVAGFINGIFTAMENSVTKYLEDCARGVYMSLICSDIAKGGNVAVNLLQRYYDETGIELTSATARYNADYKRWLTSIFTDYVNLFEEMTVLFNHKEYETFTPRSACHFVLNSKVADDIKRFMTSDVFNDELVSLPNYAEISSWQGIGTGGSYFDRIGIDAKVKNPKYVSGGTEPEYLTAKTNIIAVMHDDRVLSLSLKDRRTVTEPNEHGARRNVWEQGVVSNFINLGHNSVVFYEDDVVKPVDVKLNKKAFEIGVNETETLTATVNPADATLTWGSSNTSVATVEDGVVTGVSAGTSIISALAEKDGATDIDLAIATISASNLSITPKTRKK